MTRIRPAVLEDQAVLADHHDALLRENGYYGASLAGYGYAAWLSATDRASSVHWVAEDAGAIVGSLGLVVVTWPPALHDGTRTAFVYGLYVEPEARRQRIATDLLEAAHAWMEATGLDQSVLVASPLAGRLYQQAGYRAVPRLWIVRALGALIGLLWARILVVRPIGKAE